MSQDAFKLERPTTRRKRGQAFHDNTKPDGTPLSQMVLFSGSTACLPGQRDLFDLSSTADNSPAATVIARGE